MEQARKVEMQTRLEHVEETNDPAFRELKQKIKNSSYEFSNQGVIITLQAYGLLDEQEKVNPLVVEIIEV